MRPYLVAILVLVLIGCNQSLPNDVADLFGTATPPPTVTPLPTETPTLEIDPYTPNGFDEFINAAMAARRADRQGLVNQYMAGLPQSPIIGPDRAILVFQVPGFAASLQSDFTGYESGEPLPLIQLPDTDLWYFSAALPANSRVDYMLVSENGRSQLDPLNPITEVSRSGPRSKLVMPAYRSPSDLQDIAITADNQRGIVSTHTLDSEALTQTRTVFVYQPPADSATLSNSTEPLPVIYVQDGTDYLNLIDAPLLLDQLIGARRIAPILVVFVPPIDRQSEYNRNDAYLQFLRDELTPFIQQTYNSSQEASQVAILGATEGGEMAVYAGLNAPNTYGLIASHSGTLENNGEALLRQLQLSQPISPAFYLSIGTIAVTYRAYSEPEVETDSSQEGTNHIAAQLAATERLAQELRQDGNRVELVMTPEGESWGFLKDQFILTLQQFFPPQPQ